MGLRSSSSFSVRMSRGRQLMTLKLLLFWIVTNLSMIIVAAAAAEGGGNGDGDGKCPDNESKRLYVFAGPHRSAASSVEEFFEKYARGRQPDGKHGSLYHALGNMRWPLVYGPLSNHTWADKPYKRFNSLILSSSQPALREEIMDAVKRDWNHPAPVSKIFFGGEEFDQVQPFIDDPNSKRNTAVLDSVEVVNEVVDYVGLTVRDCVTVVINYRLPRFEHWISIYNKLNYKPSKVDTKESLGDEIESDDDDEIRNQNSAASGGDLIKSYEEHMCGESDLDKSMRIRELGTTMNPMHIATRFLDEGYNVDMIDMSGIGSTRDGSKLPGRDIAHAIACEIMDGRCDDDKWVKGHVDETFDNERIVAKTMVEQQLIDDAETLFAYRDCAYQQQLQNHNKFRMIHRNDVWRKCDYTGSESSEMHSQIYNSLKRGIVLKQVTTEETSENKKKRPTTSVVIDNSDDDGVGSVVDGNLLLFKALLSQVECKGGKDGNGEKGGKAKNYNSKNYEVPVTMETVLNGQYIQQIVDLAASKSGSKNKEIQSFLDAESGDGGVVKSSWSFFDTSSWIGYIVGFLVLAGCCFGTGTFLGRRRRYNSRGGYGGGGRRSNPPSSYTRRSYEMTPAPSSRRQNNNGGRRSAGGRGGRSSFRDEVVNDSDSDSDDDSNSSSSSESSMEDIGMNSGKGKSSLSTSLSSIGKGGGGRGGGGSASIATNKRSSSIGEGIKGFMSRFGKKDKGEAGNSNNRDDEERAGGGGGGYSDEYYDEEEDVICFDESNSGVRNRNNGGDFI